MSSEILLRNLDVLTNEEGVLTALQEVLQLDQVAKISKILVCRDPLTNTSRGFCYLFFDNLVDSMNVHNYLKELQPALTLDSRDVGITYCIDSSAAPPQQQQQDSGAEPGNRHYEHDRHDSAYSAMEPAVQQQQQHHGSGSGHNTFQYTEADVPRLAEYSAKLYATNAAEHDHYLKYYTQYYLGEIASGHFTNLPTVSQLGGETANSGAAVAQSAMQRKMQQQHGKRSANNGRHSSEMGSGGGGGGAGYGNEGRRANPPTAPLQIPNGKDGKKYRE